MKAKKERERIDTQDERVVKGLCIDISHEVVEKIYKNAHRVGYIFIMHVDVAKGRQKKLLPTELFL